MNLKRKTINLRIISKSNRRCNNLKYQISPTSYPFSIWNYFPGFSDEKYWSEWKVLQYFGTYWSEACTSCNRSNWSHERYLVCQCADTLCIASLCVWFESLTDEHATSSNLWTYKTGFWGCALSQRQIWQTQHFTVQWGSSSSWSQQKHPELSNCALCYQNNLRLTRVILT